MKKTIGIFAHVDAGKTTFSEQLLYHTKSIKTRGRVDHKEAFLDSHKIERERGITVFSDIGIFKYEDSKYYLIDTPGHIDFSPEMERTINVLDYAIVLVSAVEGIQGHTETVWRLLEKNNIPTFIFINKMDREGSNLEKVIDGIRNTLSWEVCLIEEELYNLSDENIEFIGERNEKLNPRDVLKYFKILESKESTLNVTWSEEFQEIHIRIMGTIQLEVLKEVLYHRFNLSVDFGTPEILYKETIQGTVEGFGHFEPLRHYAEVYLKLKEGPRGSGITFKNQCHSDFLTTGSQNLIRSGYRI